MCERRDRLRALLVALSVVAACAASPHSLVAAQEVPSAEETRQAERQVLRARLQAELDSLRPLMEEAQNRASEESQARLAARRAQSERIPLDTATLGPFRVVVREGRAEDARHYFEAAWARMSPFLNGRLPEEVGGYLFSFHERIGGELLLADPSELRVSVRPWARAAEAQRAVDVAVAIAMGRAVQGWIAFAAPWDAAEPSSLGPVYRALVLSDDPAAAGCRGGELEACWLVMGLSNEPGERRRSFHAGTRGALGQIALEMGGPGALERFGAAPPGSASRERLAAAAGAPAEVVMAEWHRRVMAARPDSAGDARDVRFASLLWILLFAALSTRSTRWRLG